LEGFNFIYRKLRPNNISKDEYKKIEMKISNMSGKENEKDEQEALKGKVDDKEEKARAMWDCGSPLYDSYELVSLDHHINKNLMAFPSLHGSKLLNTRFKHNSHDMVHRMAHNVGSLEKTKKSFLVKSLSNFFVKMMKSNDNSEEKRKIENKEMRRCIAMSIVDLFSCGGNKKITCIE
jgi:hypothetical protein